MDELLARLVLGRESVKIVSVGENTMLFRRYQQGVHDDLQLTLYVGVGVKHLTSELLDVIMPAAEHNGVVIHVDACHIDAEGLLLGLGFEKWRDPDHDDFGYEWPM